MLLSLTKRWTTGLCLFVLMLLFPQLSFSQDYDNPGGTINVCAGNFNDSGGTGGNYSNNESIATSICPDIPGECVSVSFADFDLESGYDFLYINQGINTNTASALSYTGTDSPGVVSSYDATGCLTFIFTSDISFSRDGWTSTISCGTCGTPPPASSADCIGAIPICTNTISVPSLSNGEGAFSNEYDASDPNMCLDSESQSTWYIFTANATGDFGFELTPNTNTDDFDWAVFDLSNASCSDIFNNTNSLLVSCNASGGTGLNPNACSGTTGPNGGSTFTTQGGGCNTCPPSAGQGCSTENALIPVFAGNTYVLYVSNWSGSGDGYTLDFSQSTVGIIDVTPPTLDLVYQPIACGATEITFEFSENVVCSSVQTTDFTLSGPGGPYTITDVSNPDCDSGSNFGKIFTATIAPPLTSNGTYNLSIVDEVVDNCGNITPANTLNFTITNLTDASFNYDSPVYCQSSTTNPTPTTATSGGIFSASPAGLVIDPTTGTIGLNASIPGTYTVSYEVTDAGCTGTQTQTVTISTGTTTTITASAMVLDCNNPTVTLDAGAGFVSYEWSNNDDTQIITIANADTYTVTVTDSDGCTGTASIEITEDFDVPFLSITPSESQFNCNTSSIVLEAGAGFDAYIWSTNESSQIITINNSGTYTVTVTDNSTGCTNSAAITISENFTLPSVNITAPTTVLDCENTLIVLDAGAGFDTYEWSQSGTTQTITISNPGTYTVTVTDANNGCTNTASVTITEDTTAPSTTITAPTTVLDCNTTGILLDAGAGFAAYEWSNNDNGQTTTVTSPNTYTVTITDANNGCTSTASILITQEADTPSTSIAAATTILTCDITSINLDAGAGFDTYEWSNNDNGQTTTVTGPNTYTVTVTDATNGCTATASIEITEDTTPPTALITPSSNISFCEGEDVELVASGGISYEWSNGLGTNPSVTVNTSDTYTVTVTGINSCTSVSSVTVAEYPPLQITNLTQTCNAANTAYTVSFDIIGGDGNYTVNGNPSSSTYTSNLILSATTYSYTIDDMSSCEPVVVSGAYSCISGSCFSGTGCTGPNLIINGDFEAGNTGFTSDYDYSPCPGNCGSGLLCQYAYGIETTPNDCNPDFSNSITDHTSGNGNMMVIDFPDSDVSPNNRIWCQTVAVDPGKDYCFGAYFINLLNSGSNQPEPLFEFTVDGVNIGTTTSLPETEQWIFEGFQFNSNTSTSIDICILNNNFGNVGYDLAIDDISLKETNPGNPPTVLDDNIEICPEENIAVIDVLDNDMSFLGLDLSTFAIESAPPFSEGSITDINAADGTITFVPSANFSGDVTFTYTICDNFGCCDIASVNVLESTPPTINATVYDVNCIGSGAIDLMVTGGVPPYNYDWSDDTYDNQEDIAAPVGNYSVTVTDANGCSSSNSFTILEDLNPPIAVMTSAETELTCDLTVITLDASSSNGQNTISYLWSDASVGSTLDVTSAGTYTVTVTDSKNGCTSSTELDITADIDAPTANITSLDTELTCNLTSTTLDASSSSGQGTISYEWEDGSTNPTLDVNAIGTYTVTVTDSQNGCTASQEIIVTENIDAPIANITSTETVLSCTVTNITLDASSSTGQGTISYEWEDGSTNPTLDVDAIGTYTVTVTDSQNGCTASQEIIITTDNSAPTAQIIASELEFNCLINSMDLDASGSMGTNVTYEWQDGSTNPVLTITTAGDYTVTVTDGNTGCTNSTSINIELNDTPPGIQILPTTPVLTCDTPCVTLTIAFDSITIYGGAIWNDGSTADSLVACSPGVYSVTVTDGANGCTVTESVTVTELTTPPSFTIIASSDTLDCNNPTVTLAADGADGVTYEWSTMETDSSIVISTPGTYAVTVTDPSSGCTSADNITIEESIINMPVITGNLTICDGESTTLDATTNGISSYNWSNGQTSTSISVNTPGEYTVTVSDGNCSETASVTVIQNANPSTSIMGDAVICEGNTTTLDAGAGFASYTWSNTDMSQTTAITDAGTYTVTVTSAEGCEGTASFQVSVNPSPIYNVINDTTICSGGLVNLGTVVAQGTSYSWTANPADPTLVNPTIGTPSASPVQTTTYTLTATNGSCSETTSVTVTVAEPMLEADNTTICGGDFTTLSANGTPVGGTYSWTDWEGTVIGTEANIEVGPFASTSYVVTYTIGDCSVSTVVEVDVVEDPGIAINYTPTTEIFAGQDVSLSADNVPAGSTVEWTSSTGDNLSGEEVLVTPLENTTYIVTVTTPEGCVYTSEVYIPVTILDTDIPNIFTPNGDDLNDSFYIINPGFANKIIEFKIFDRWGTLIHDNAGTPWDGTFKGKNMPSDIYVYLFRIQSSNGSEELLKGDVALMR